MSIENKLKIVAQIGGLAAFGFLAGSCAAEIKAQNVNSPVEAAPKPSLPVDSNKEPFATGKGWLIYRYSEQTARVEINGSFVHNPLQQALRHIEIVNGCQLIDINEIPRLYSFLVIVEDKNCLPGQ